MQPNKGIIVHREVLLIEIDRHCLFAGCNARVFLGLTRQEALDYKGFECPHCQRWNDDCLEEKDIPDSWNERNPGSKTVKNSIILRGSP
jgi:hypothetical protein